MARFKIGNTIKNPEKITPEQGEKTKKELEKNKEEYNKVSKKLKKHNSRLKIFFIIVILLGVYSGCVVAIHYATGGKIKFNF